MTTTVSLVNIHQHIWLQYFFLVMRTFKIYSFSAMVQIHSTELQTAITILYIRSLELTHHA